MAALVNGEPLTNGHIHSNSASGSGKRKRYEEMETPQNDKDLGNVERERRRKERMDDLLGDILVLLREHDTSPSVFEHPLPASNTETRPTKRAKTHHAPATTTIKAKVESRLYKTIDGFLGDFDVATSGSRAAALYPEKMQTLKESLESILHTEVQRTAWFATEASSDEVKAEHQPNGYDVESETALDLSANAKFALTITAQLMGNKQLFSSLPLPGSQLEDVAQVVEKQLPNGVLTTTILPFNTEDAKPESARTPTIAEISHATPNVPVAVPPKPSKISRTEDEVVNWYTPGEVYTRKRRNSKPTFTDQPLSTGQWLSYKNVSEAADGEDGSRKGRARTSSLGEIVGEDDEAAQQEQRRREDVLFKSVYSNFAPDRDDTGAVVPATIRARMWFKKQAALQKPVLDLSPPSTDSLAKQVDLKPEQLEELLQDWEEEIEPELNPDVSVDGEEEDKDLEFILQEVSDMMEELISRRRLRELTTAGSKSKTDDSGSSSLTTPSETEVEVYKTLTAQLEMLVAMLPPYAVSRLNGDRLKQLDISQRIPTEIEGRKGTLEGYNAPTGRTPSTVPIVARPALQTTTKYSQTGTPTQSIRPNFTTSTPRTAPPVGYNSQYSAPRSGANQYGSYTVHGPPRSYSQFERHNQSQSQASTNFTNGPRQYAPSTSYTTFSQSQYNTAGTGTPTPGGAGSYQRPSSYQPRPTMTHTGSSGTSGVHRSNDPRSASPPNPKYVPQAPMASQADALPPRPSYSPPVTATAAVIGGHASPTTLTHSARISAEEQADLLQRQARQLEAQDAARRASTGAGSRPGSSRGASAGVVNSGSPVDGDE